MSTAMISRNSVIAACTPSTDVSRSCVMSLIITFMFEPAKLQMNCASASGARKRGRGRAEGGSGGGRRRPSRRRSRSCGPPPANAGHGPSLRRAARARKDARTMTPAGAHPPVAVLPARRPLARREADLAVRLEHREPNVVERADLLQARLGLELLDGHALPLHVALEDPAVRDEDDRLA